MAKPATTPCYRVARGRTRMWDVFEIGVDIAIASFHGRTAAVAYARRLAARRGAEVLVDPSPRPRTANVA
jgi:hypothetical protein